jgi:Zn-dependent peptidase ImmA (M78 family)
MPATMRVEVNPVLLRWARDRAGLTVDDLLHRFPKLSEWEAGTAKPTLRQLEAFASAVAVPFGYLFLPEPPQETLPVPDFRTLDDRQVTRPSPDLLETIFDMQRRQAWLRDDRIEAGYDPLSFVGSVTAQALPAVVAAAIRRTIGIADSWAELHGTWTDALNWLRSRAEMIGIIIVINGVVGNNTSRKLDPEEFRGFVLPDDYAPFVFINGADGKAAQMFTLAHELVHLWINQAGVFNLRAMQPAPDPREAFCNAVAAEFLIPEQELQSAWRDAARTPQRFATLARRFKVSELVVARRALDARLINRDAFFRFYNTYQEDERRRADRRASGGDFYKTQNSRVGRVFAEAVARAVKEGRLLYRDAFELTGLRGATFDKYVATVEGAAPG